MVYWKVEPFDALSTQALYAILALRQRVFVVEQNCAYLDADGLDAHCYHVQGWQNGALVAYARILPPQLAGPQPAIGRVITAPEARGQGFGKQIILVAIEHTKQLYGRQTIHLSAQKYLTRFYTELGFRPNGHEYLEDGIPHIGMDLIESN